MSVAAPPTGLLSADEFARLPDTGKAVELVRGQIVEVPMPPPRHGLYCWQIARHIGNYVQEHKLGRVMINDSWVKTQDRPDTVRGADFIFWSYQRLPHGKIPEGVIPNPPDLVVEVRSPNERWTEAFGKVLEYLNAGVRVTCILDPGTETLSVYRPDELQQILTADDEFSLPDLLGDLRVKVSRFFVEE
jgi:Uma2 family endonuclease